MAFDYVRLGFAGLCLYCLLLSQNYAEVTSLKLVRPAAAVLSYISNAISDINVTQQLTDAGLNLQKKTLVALTAGQIKNASSYTDFYLATRESGKNTSKVGPGDKAAILEAGFSVYRCTKIIIHGYFEDKKSYFETEGTEAFLAAEDLNVIIVDWHKLAWQLYPVAVDATSYIGQYVGSFVDFLVQDVGVDISSIHVLGFSLGAHIAGVAGRSITCGQLPWITGLDPAGPFFTNENTHARLDPSDAKFVEALHTCAGVFGYAGRCGHMDIYFNGGFPPQPGCLEAICSHGRCFRYYTESISSNRFIATQCNSYKSYKKGECSHNRTAVVGYHVDKSLEGVWFLDTNAKSPYAKGVSSNK